jgi:hypothetical protein
MPTVTTPTDRLKRILSEGARFTATCPQQTSIDVTPDIMALLGGDSNIHKTLDSGGNLLETNDLGWDVATGVQFV